MKYAQLFIGAGLALFGIWIGMAFATATDAGAEAKWWDLMTAFGTVGAVAVAVSLGFREAWRQKANDQLVGSLEAARIYSGLVAVTGRCELIRNWFDCIKSGQPNEVEYSSIRKAIEWCLATLKEIDLVALGRWKPESANKLASAAGAFSFHLTSIGAADSYKNSNADFDQNIFAETCELLNQVCVTFHHSDLPVMASSTLVLRDKKTGQQRETTK